MNKLQYVSPQADTIVLVAERIVCESINSGSGTGDLNLIVEDPWAPLI
jgi:hypothetical protein